MRDPSMATQLGGGRGRIRTRPIRQQNPCPVMSSSNLCLRSQFRELIPLLQVVYPGDGASGKSQQQVS